MNISVIILLRQIFRKINYLCIVQYNTVDKLKYKKRRYFNVTQLLKIVPIRRQKYFTGHLCVAQYTMLKYPLMYIAIRTELVLYNSTLFKNIFCFILI